jgi:hypothetical protein
MIRRASRPIPWRVRRLLSAALDRPLLVPLDDGGPTDVRAARTGDGPGPRRRDPRTLLAMGALGLLRPPGHRECDQHRGGSGRDGGGDHDGDRRSGRADGPRLRRRDRRAVDVVVLPHDRPGVQVADARAPRLRLHRVRRTRRLAVPGAGDAPSAYGMVARLLLRPGRDPWHDDLAVPVVLAGGAGSRRRARDGPQSGAAPWRDARGTHRLSYGRHHGHVRLERDHVLTSSS